MFNKLFEILKKIITSSVLIYMYDSLNLSLDIFIPINVITVFIVFLFGIWGIAGIVILSLFI